MVFAFTLRRLSNPRKLWSFAITLIFQRLPNSNSGSRSISRIYKLQEFQEVVYLSGRVPCRTTVATCDAHWGANGAEAVDGSACDKDDKPPVWRSVSRCCNSPSFADSAGRPVSLPAEVLENSLRKYETQSID